MCRVQDHVCGVHVIEYIGHSDILSEIEAEAQLCLNNIFDSLLHLQDVRICVQCTCNKLFCAVWVSVAGYRALWRNMGLFCETYDDLVERRSVAMKCHVLSGT